MSAINHPVIADRLTVSRLGSYLTTTSGDLETAIRLYDWNIRAGGSFHEDLGRLEVVFRNTIDAALVTYGSSQGWSTVWYQRSRLFLHSARARKDIDSARSRATWRGRTETHGRVLAELSFGFWRYLCTASYLTSLWVPALAGAFPRHPKVGNPRAVRADVEDRIQRLHYLRNRIAHHEPIHQRDLKRDLNDLVELAGWICTDTQVWVTNESRTAAVLRARPEQTGSRNRRGGRGDGCGIDEAGRITATG